MSSKCALNDPNWAQKSLKELKWAWISLNEPKCAQMYLNMLKGTEWGEISSNESE